MELNAVAAKLGRSVDALIEEYAQVSGMLSRLGLSEYESRAYIALVAVGQSSPGFVAQLAQIPRTSSYKVMEGLEAKGFAQSKPGRPKSYSAVDPSEVADRIVTEVNDAFNKLGSIRNLLSERGTPQLVYTIMGKERVFEKIGEMLDRSEHTFVISSPSVPIIRKRLGKRFANASGRGVRVQVITNPFVKAPKGAEVIRRTGLIATDVISDGKTALLAAPDLSACGYTDNEALSAHLEEFLKVMTESGS